VALNRFEAEAAIQKLGPNLVVEEFLEGDEVSFIGVSDGVNLIPFLPAQDHKRLSNNDTGENTGGMGAYVDKRILTEHESGVIMDRIMLPTLSRMRHEGSPFTGFLFAGLMMTADGPKVLEFNVRLGDPETQAILHNFQGDFAELLMSRPSQAASTGCSVSITLAASGYPGTPLTGDAIHGIEDAESTGATVFHAGTKMVGTQLVTNGGRVLSVTAGGATLPAAIECAYRAAGKIHFAGMHYRTDIGAKGLKRWNNQSSG
jgi:phosphoribosylamine--glycine ligase